jgi:large subunit ribosomal protein L24
MFMAFSTSVQPRKQRKARYSAPLHERQKLVHAHVSKEAREKQKVSAWSAAVREGDRVKVMRGKFRGKSGKVSEVSLADSKNYVEGVVARKAKGAEVLAPIDPSNVQILEFDLSDKVRKAILGRKGAVGGTGAARKAAPASG